MKTIKMLLRNDYEVEVDDDYNPEDDDNALLFEKLEDQILSNNQTISNEFWESVYVKLNK